MLHKLFTVVTPLINNIYHNRKMCVVKYLFASQIAVCFIFTFRDLFMFLVSNLNLPLIEQLLSRGYVRCRLLSTQMLPAHPHHLSTSTYTNERVVCEWFSEETLRVGDPHYLVSMPGDVKKNHTGKWKTCL